MVATIRIPDTAQDALVITPYAPLSWPASLLLLFVICAPIMGAAIVSGLFGNWLALPVSSVLCVVIGLAFRSGYRRTQRREVVTLIGDAVSIERGHRYPESRCAIPRDDAEVLLQTSAPDAHEHLYLCAREQKIEIGEFLDDRERHELADKLRRMIRSAGTMGPLLTA